MPIYFIYKSPFNEVMTNRLGIYNEVVIIVIFVSTFIMNLINLPDIVIRIWNWILVGAIIVSLIFVWLITIPKALKELCKKKPKPKIIIKKPEKIIVIHRDMKSAQKEEKAISKAQNEETKCPIKNTNNGKVMETQSIKKHDQANIESITNRKRKDENEDPRIVD